MSTSISISPSSGEFAIDTLADAVRKGANILVCGNASSGKTSFLCSLAAQVPLFERVIVIDDTRTLSVLGGDAATVQQVPAAGERCLVQWALETYPNRLIVDDIRDREVAEFVRAHGFRRLGGLASMHATSARRALDRVEALVAGNSSPTDVTDLSGVRLAISRCFHYVVHLQREGTRRYVSEVLAVLGFKDGDYVLKHVF